MPRNAGGVYTLPPSNPVITDTPIASSGWANPTMTDIAAALTESIAKTGVTTASANLPMGGFKHLSVATATAFDQYTQAGQTQTSVLIHATSVTMPVADQYAAALVLGPITFVTGQMVVIAFPTTNIGPSTLNINGSGARALVKATGVPLSPGNCVVGNQFIIIFDGTNWRMWIDATGLTSAEVIASLGYVPVASNGSIPMTGQLTLVSPPVAATDAASKTYVDNLGRVVSFNTRTGAVTLLSADVTTALTYTPLNKAGDTMLGDLSFGNRALPLAKTVSFNGEIVATTGGAGQNINFTLGQKQKSTLTANVTGATTFTFPGVGHYQYWLVSGAFTFSWPAVSATWQWLNSPSAPILNTGTYGGIVTLYYNGTMTVASYAAVGA